MSIIIIFFCFKLKPAYEMRISDWSSDVCSSDLTRSASSSPPAPAASSSAPWRSGCSCSAAAHPSRSSTSSSDEPMTTTQAPPTPIDEVPDTAGRRPRRRLGRVLLAALAVLVVAEVGVRLVEDRLPPPPDWYTPEYGVKERQLRDLAAEGGASVALLGSSVIDVAVDPAGLDGPVTADRPAYNAGLIGANLEMVRSEEHTSELQSLMR